MKILLLSVTAGYGHHATAKALADLFEQKGAEVEIVDVYEYISKMIQQALAKGYLLSSKYTPELYRLFYDKTSQTKEKLNKMNMVKLVNTLGAFRFESFVENFEPDAIVCTHVLAAHLVSQMKQRGMVTAPSIGIATDYCIHPYWEDVLYMDGLVIASELITQTAVKRGIPEQRLLPFGIPVHPKFNQHIQKTEARRQLGLDAERPVLLVMSGSMGFGKVNLLVAELIRKLEADEYVVVICGNNRRLRQILQTTFGKNPQVRILGFTDHVPAYMDASDVIFSKPGGLTSTEAAVRQIALVHTSPIPGCETKNLAFFTSHGMSVTARTVHGQVTLGRRLMKNEDARIEMQKQQNHCIPHDSAVEICRLAEKLYAQRNHL